METFRQGQRVWHSVFGYGAVVESKGKDDDQRIVVNFDAGGEKRLAAKFAKLRRVGRDEETTAPPLRAHSVAPGAAPTPEAEKVAAPAPPETKGASPTDESRPSKGPLLDALDEFLAKHPKAESPEEDVGADREPPAKIDEEAKMPRELIDDDQIIELHKQGLHDSEIAKQMGVTLGAVMAHRRKLGLKINGSLRGKHSSRNGSATVHKLQRKTAKAAAELNTRLHPPESAAIEAVPVAGVARVSAPATDAGGDTGATNGHAELRVVMFEFKGSAASADKAFAAIQAALAR